MHGAKGYGQVQVTADALVRMPARIQDIDELVRHGASRPALGHRSVRTPACRTSTAIVEIEFELPEAGSQRLVRIPGPSR